MTKPPPWQRLSSMKLWLAPGMGVKRHVTFAVFGGVLLVIGVTLAILWLFAGDRELLSEPIENILVSGPWERWGIWASIAIIIGGVVIAVQAVGSLNRSLLSHWLERPSEAAEVLFRELKLSRGPKIVALGGGTGLSMLLRGLRSYTSNLTAVVSVADDGGSSGRLRQEFGMPAPGDLSDCLAALSDRDMELGKLLQYRFVRGKELMGHTFGNLLITTLTEVQGDFGAAIDALNSLLDLKGRVYPAATQPVSLVALKDGGVEVTGESSLREVAGPVRQLRIEPAEVAGLPRVSAQIASADVIVLGPGSLFSSTIPPILVNDVRKAVLKRKAPLVYVCNIMTEAGETDAMSAFDHVRVLQEHLGVWPDIVVINGQPLDEPRRQAYRLEQAEPVEFDPAEFEEQGIAYVILDLLSRGEQAYHDSDVLAEWLLEYGRQQQTESWARTRP